MSSGDDLPFPVPVHTPSPECGVTPEEHASSEAGEPTSGGSPSGGPTSGGFASDAAPVADYEDDLSLYALWFFSALVSKFSPIPICLAPETDENFWNVRRADSDALSETAEFLGRQVAGRFRKLQQEVSRLRHHNEENEKLLRAKNAGTVLL